MSTCPSHDDFKQYVLGILSTDRAEVIEAHLDTCELCQVTLDELAAESDDLVQAVRQSQGDATIELDSGWKQAEALVKAIGREWSQAAQPVTTTTIQVRQLREYELLEELGHGGMGTVYKALHTKLNKIVSLKVLPSDRMENSDAVRRFEREMQAVGRLDHPHIVRATDAGEVDGTHFLVMEYVDGIDLSNLVSRIGPLPVPEACEIVRQAALGLQHADEHGMVHRDIKPSNLMLSGGPRERAASLSREGTVPLLHHRESPTVKILDLGLALLHDNPAEGGELTATDQVMGTLDYMAPEQAADTHAVDIRADLYSLGATLYKLLSGKAPFGNRGGRSPAAKLNAVLNSSPAPIEEQRRDLPQELAELIGRLLDKNPDVRPATPAELIRILSPFTEGADLGRLMDSTLVGRLQTTLTSTKTASSMNVSSRLIETDPDVSRHATSPARTPASTEPSPDPPRFKRWGWPIGAAALILVLLSGIVIQLKTRAGTLSIDVGDHPAAVVKIDGETVNVERDGRLLKLSVDPGTHELVVETTDGTVLRTDAENGKITIEAGADRRVTAWLEPRADETQGPSTDPSAAPVVVWDPGPAKNALPGIIPRPAEIPGLHRWQMETVMPRGDARSVAWHPDGDLVACGSVNGQIRLYEADDLKLVKILAGHTNPVDTLDWSPDGTSIAAAGGDANVRIWNFDSGTSQVLATTLIKVRAVAWSPNGQWLAAGGGHGPDHIQIWTADGTPVSTLTAGKAMSLAWSPDSEWLAAGHVEITLWKPDGTPGPVMSGHEGGWSSVAWSHDGQWLASAGQDQTVRLWQVDGTPGPVLEGHRQGPNAVSWNQEGRLISAGVDIHLWRQDRKTSAVIDGGAHTMDLAWSPDGERFVAVGERGIAVHDFEGNVVVERQPSYYDRVNSVAWRPDGGTLATMSASEVWFWGSDGASAKPVGGIGGGGLAWSPTGDLLAGSGGNGHVHVWDEHGNGLREVIRFPAAGGPLAWKPDGNWIAVTTGDGTVRLVHRDGTPGPVLETGMGLLTNVDWSPDGRWITSCSNQHGPGIQLWNPDGTPGPELFQSGDLRYGITSAAWDPRGEWLATGGGPKSSYALHLWNMDGEVVQAFPTSHNHIRSIAWSPGGERFIAASHDHTLQLCELDGTSQLITDHDGPAFSVSWARKGNRIASGSLDQTLIVWDADTAEPEWVGVMLYGDKQAASFTAAGKPLFLTEDVADELVYIVERVPGRQELWSYGEFQEYLATGQSPRGGYDAHRALAEWVLREGGNVWIRSDDGEVTVAAMDELPDSAKLFQVDVVDLNGLQRIDDDDMRMLRSLCPRASLYHLNLTGTGITDSALDELAGMEIEQLLLVGTAITDAVASKLGAIRGLKHLSVGNTSISDASCAELAMLQELRFLQLSETQVTDQGALHLAALPNLQELQISRNPGVGDATLRWVAEHPFAVALLITKSSVTDEGLTYLVDSGMRRIELNGCQAITAAGLKTLSQVESLETIKLSGLQSVTDEILAHLAVLPDVNNLDLHETPVTDKGLQALERMTSLRELRIYQTQVTAAGVARLHEALPACTIIWDGGTLGPATDNHALQFDGVDMVDIPSLANDGQTALTVEAWARPTPAPNQGGTVLNAAGAGVFLQPSSDER